ncbi:MAG: STAS domain-containing protein [bacterium]
MAEKATMFRTMKAKGSVTIYVDGDFTYEHTGAFKTQVKKLIAECECVPKIRLDLADCSFVDSGCMGVMAHVQKELNSKGGELRVVNAAPLVLEAMRRIRLDAILPIRGKKK